jgi:hypothetical protein
MWLRESKQTFRQNVEQTTLPYGKTHRSLLATSYPISLATPFMPRDYRRVLPSSGALENNRCGNMYRLSPSITALSQCDTP